MSTILAILVALGIVALMVISFLLGTLNGLFIAAKDLVTSLNLDERDEDV